MALVVEDGTGLSNAESYISVVDADAYHTAMGNVLWTGAEELKEGALRRATQYMDAVYTWRGEPLEDDQALGYPRDFADWPVRNIREACCELALRALTAALVVDVDSTAVKSETVGPISITYADRKNNGQLKYPIVTALLRRYTMSTNVVKLERTS